MEMGREAGKLVAVLSPAKRMAAVSLFGRAMTRPVFEADAAHLAEELKSCPAWRLEPLLGVNPELAVQAFCAYQEFDRAGEFPALLSYRGLAYQYVEAETLSREDWDFAQEHLRLFSALYGLLRPLDGIHPYRLELQCRFRPDGRTLYAYWGNRVWEELYRERPTVINLASEEYSRLVSRYRRPEQEWITCEFRTFRRGKLVTLPALAKMARGRMARAIIRNRWERPGQLAAFDEDGYRFRPELSDTARMVFVQE